MGQRGLGRAGAFEASRRGFLRAAGAGALGMAGWRPAFEAGAGSRSATLAPPPRFPGGIPCYQQAYENWSREIRIEGLWTAAPRSPEEVLELVEWARAEGWRVRPKGRSHGWSPLLLPGGTAPGHHLLVDTTRHLARVTVDRAGPVPTVTAGTGASMDRILETMGAAGLGFTTTPAPGDVTLGGVLAVGGHGAALPGEGERPVPGKGYGSLSNAVLSLTAVVWDGRERYRLRTFHRDEPGIQALLVHLGRAFITEATLQAGPDANLRCRSSFDIGAEELFAPPERAGRRSFQAWLRCSGRVEAIWFPFAEVPWLKVWSLEPERPWLSRAVQGPYSYTFANWVSPDQARFIDQLVKGDLAATPGFQQLEMAAVGAGLAFTGTWDIWGPSRYSTLYVLPTTLRLAENGYAVLTRRDNVQWVVHRFFAAYRDMLRRRQERGEYPMNGPVEIRVTGLDDPAEVCWPGALPALLSPLRPRPDRPAWDCAVWINALTFPGTPGENAFKAELESWLLEHFNGEEAGVRVEWAKGWGYTPAGAWTDLGMLGKGIPEAFDAGQGPGGGWAEALACLDRMDPWRVFSNPFLDRLMP